MSAVTDTALPSGPAVDLFARVRAAATEQALSPAISALPNGALLATSIALGDMLHSIEKGEVAATPIQVAFFMGAQAAIQGVLRAEQAA